MPVAPVLPWDLDRLPLEVLEARYTEMADFANWLAVAGIPIPLCWYAHRAMVYRFAALMFWYRDAHRSESAASNGRSIAASTARDAAEWWASQWSISGWLAGFERLPCKGRPSGHRSDGPNAPVPPFSEAVEAHLMWLRTFAER